MAIRKTLTSANTVSHMLAIPTAPSSSTIPFTPHTKKIFCHTIPLILAAILMAVTNLDSVSFINTISAVSMAASESNLPIAILCPLLPARESVLLE